MLYGSIVPKQTDWSRGLLEISSFDGFSNIYFIFVDIYYAFLCIRF